MLDLATYLIAEADNVSSLDRSLKLVYLVKLVKAAHALLVPGYGGSQTRREAFLAACVHSLGTEVRN